MGVLFRLTGALNRQLNWAWSVEGGFIIVHLPLALCFRKAATSWSWLPTTYDPSAYIRIQKATVVRVLKTTIPVQAIDRQQTIRKKMDKKMKIRRKMQKVWCLNCYKQWWSGGWSGNGSFFNRWDWKLPSGFPSEHEGRTIRISIKRPRGGRA